MIKEKYEKLTKEIDGLRTRTESLDQALPHERMRFVGDLADARVGIMRLTDDLVFEGRYKEGRVYIEDLYSRMCEVEERYRTSMNRGAVA